MNQKPLSKMNKREKLALLDSEVRSFYEYCREAGMSDEELDLISRPLTNAVREAYIQKWTRIVLFIIMVIALGYTISQSETIQWHSSAVGRIILIKILPFWDWTSLYHNQCLIERPLSQSADDPALDTLPDCVACEAIDKVAYVSSTNYQDVFNNHLIRGAPVIVTDAYHDWAMPQADFNLTTLIRDDERLSNSVPCRIQTNLRFGRQPMDLEEIFSRITNINVPNWFVHFQNCDTRAVKSFRILAPRPYFLSPHIPPSHFNWILLSNNYNAQKYKFLQLDAGLIIMSQLKGENLVQLKPKSPCGGDCGILNLTLNEGETLVLTNSVWDFGYLPGKSENLAIVTETDWYDS